MPNEECLERVLEHLLTMEERIFEQGRFSAQIDLGAPEVRRRTISSSDLSIGCCPRRSGMIHCEPRFAQVDGASDSPRFLQDLAPDLAPPREHLA